MTHVLVPLADGFEEIEAISVIDLLRRADIKVTTAALSGDKATGSHGIAVLCDEALASIQGEFDLLVLPGGMPGAKHLREDVRVKEWIHKLHSSGAYLGAICAAPMALAAAGVLDGKKATCFPGFLDEFPQVQQTGALVEQDGNIITARGPGAAMDFGLALIEVLKGKADRDAVESRLQRAS